MTRSSLPVFLADPLPIMGPALLAGPEGHHAARVRRLGVGEWLLLTDGRGGVARAQITEAHGAALGLHVSQVDQIPPAPLRVVVVQALPKGERSELAIELLTELGVDEIVPWAASRCVTRWQGERGIKGLERWRSIAREAAKQSRRLWWPTVSDLVSSNDLAKRLSNSETAFVLHESASQRLALANLATDVGEILLIVGPEGGITSEELELFTGVGAQIVRLGDNILRTSTAGATAVATIFTRTTWRRG